MEDSANQSEKKVGDVSAENESIPAKEKSHGKKGGKGAAAAVVVPGSDTEAKSEEGDAAKEAAGVDSKAQLLRWLEMLSLNSNNSRKTKTSEEATKHNYKFWSTQPVPQLDDEQICENEAIEADKAIAEIRVEPYSLPDGFEWETMTIDNQAELKELYTLLYENYVEDDDAMFRFDYQPDFLKWALQPPGWRAEWHVGVRVSKSKKLVGFISAIPGQVRVYDKVLRIVEINFLCVHKKLRAKRVAPVLIREITRRVNLTGIFQAVYTAGVVLPKPVATCRYWHRSLNAKKLIDVQFSHLSRNMTMQRYVKLYKLPEQTKVAGFRPMRPEDLKKASVLLRNHLKKFSMAPVFDDEEFAHWFTPRKDIVNAYVVEKEGVITDMVSFYTLPSTVMQHPVHKCIKSAYSFYNVATGNSWVDLMNDALISAKNQNYDVFNALDLMENKEFLQPLKFGIGDGNLQYYLYNWRCPSMSSEQMGLILM